MRREAVGTVLSELAAVALALNRKDIATLLSVLAQRHATAEWVLLMLGETSSGKSTWCNSLLDDALLPATPDPTTGAVVEIRVRDDLASPRFEALWRDGTETELDRAAFRELCRASDGPLRLRVWWPLGCVAPRARAKMAALAGLVLVDAPGYNACLGGHTEVLNDILPEADAVVAMLSFQRGFTPEDQGFVDLMHRRLGAQEHQSLQFAVNWAPDVGGGRRLAEMSRHVSRAVGRPAALYPLRRLAGDGFPHVWSDDLWSAVTTWAERPDRQQRVEDNLLALAEGVARELAEDLTARLGVAQAAEAQLERWRARITQREGQAKEALRIIDEAETRMHAIVEHACWGARDALWSAVDSCVDEAGRFSGAQDCTAYVADHLVPHHVQATVDAMEQPLCDASDALGEALDKLQQDVDASETPPPLVLRTPNWEHVRNYAAAQAGKQLSSLAFTRYLSSLGGAAGPKSGFVNLAKKLVSGAGRLVGKKFPIEIYYGMGRTLARIGLSAGLATAVVVGVTVEVGSYVYGLVRWKAHLRGRMQRVLGLDPTHEPVEDRLMRKVPLLGHRDRQPFAELVAESNSAISEAMSSTRELVDRNFGRRGEVLRDALRSRTQGACGDLARLDGLASRFAEAVGRLERLKGEGSDV